MVKLNNRFLFSLKPIAPYDFELTVRKPARWELFTQFEEFKNGTLWTAIHIENVLIGLKLRSSGTVSKPEVRIEIYTKNKITSQLKAKIKEKIAWNLSTNEDLSGFYKMAKKDHILKHTLKDLNGMHWTNFESVFSAVILSITLQMAPLKRSQEMLGCMIESYGEKAEFDGKSIYSEPTPKQIAKQTPESMAKKCKLGYRAKSIVKSAKQLEKGDFPTFIELSKLPAEEAKEKLMELFGIGDYSSDIINPNRGFPIDVWSAEVFGMLFYGKSPKNNREAVEKVKKEGIKRWGKWSWMAFFYIVHNLENLSEKLDLKLRLE